MNMRKTLGILLMVSLALNGFELWKFQRSRVERPVLSQRAEGPHAALRAAWKSLYSSDLATFTKNLRIAGVPDRWIRGVISDQIEATFRAREQALRPTKKLKFWQRDDSIPSIQTSLALLDLRREKARVRATLLGPEATAQENTDAYGLVPVDSRELVRTIKEDYDTMIQALRKQVGYLPTAEGRAQIVYLEKEKERELREHLTDEQIAALEMRTSELCGRVREDLRYFSVSESEFAAIYTARKGLERFSRAIEGEDNVGAWNREEQQNQFSIERRIKDDLAQSLGSDRYAAYLRSQIYEYGMVRSLAERAGLPESLAERAFDFRETVAADSRRIFDDQSLGKEEKRTALKNLVAQARAQLVSTLGADAGRAYGRISWLKEIEKGAAMSFTEKGYSFRTLDPED